MMRLAIKTALAWVLIVAALFVFKHVAIYLSTTSWMADHGEEILLGIGLLIPAAFLAAAHDGAL